MRGSLGEFRLAEILQLVAVQQKTGLLRLVRGESTITFYFDRGILVSSRDRRQDAPDPLLDYMVRTGWIEPGIAALLRARTQGSKDDVAGLLLLERYLTEDELRIVLEDLTQDLVFKTFGWRTGTYEFIGGPTALAAVQYRIALQVDSVLMEAARRADEWPRLEERLPGPDVVLEFVREPGPEIGERACEVLNRIAGRTTLGELVRSCRMSEFEVYEIIAQAAESGMVRIEVPPRRAPEPRVEPPAPPEPERRRPSNRPWQPELRAWGIAAGVALLVAVGSKALAPALRSPAVRSELRAVEIAEARENVRLQIEIYRAAHGRYPSQLADLVADELLRASQLARAAPIRYAVSPDGRKYELGLPPPGLESAGTESSRPGS